MRGFMKDVFFETAFTQDAVPSYRCPVCMEGDLIKEEFFSESTALTKKIMRMTGGSLIMMSMFFG